MANKAASKKSDLTLPDTLTDLGRLLEIKKRRQLSVTLALDPDDQTAMAKAKQAVTDATEAAAVNSSSATLKARSDAERELGRLKESIQTVTFVFESIGADASEQLLQAHKATPQQQKKHQADHPGQFLQHDPIEYPLARIAACLVEIRYPNGDVSREGLDHEQVRELFRSAKWTTADREQLGETARAVDVVFNSVDLSTAGND